MSEDRQERFAAYVDALTEVIGHADRAAPLRDYCLGLLLPGARKSVEPIAAVTAPARVSAKHQSLLHFVANAPWSNERVLSRIQELTLPLLEGSGAIEAWIIDDTGFPKKGRHSVGVARGVVLMDAGYGANTWLREEMGALGLSYVAGIPPQTSVWPPGTAPLPPLPWWGRGRRPKLMRRDAEHRPVSTTAGVEA